MVNFCHSGPKYFRCTCKCTCMDSLTNQPTGFSQHRPRPTRKQGQIAYCALGKLLKYRLVNSGFPFENSNSNVQFFSYFGLWRSIYCLAKHIFTCQKALCRIEFTNGPIKRPKGSVYRPFSTLRQQISIGQSSKPDLTYL